MHHLIVPGASAGLLVIYSAFLLFLQVSGVQVPSGVWWLGTSSITLLGLVATLLWELRTRSTSARQKEYEFARERIKTSLKNFGQIRTIQSGERKFSGFDHRRAVTVQCFEVLDESAEPLKKYWRLRSLISKLLAENDIQRA